MLPVVTKSTTKKKSPTTTTATTTSSSSSSDKTTTTTTTPTSMEDLMKEAGMDPSQLDAIVAPFVATKEGQRLVRSSKQPDLEEVTYWITWAGQARPLAA